MVPIQFKSGEQNFEADTFDNFHPKLSPAIIKGKEETLFCL